MSELYLVRHAQAQLGARHYDELSALGVQQSVCLADYFHERDIKFDGFISGDMQRHKHTLEIIKERLGGVSSDKIRGGFNEYDFKKMIAVFAQQYPDDEIYAASMQQTTDRKRYFRLLRQVLIKWSENKITGLDESWQDFHHRVANEKSLLQQKAASGERLLVVSSGGAISMFIGQVLGVTAETIIDLNLQMKNTSISQFVYNKDKISLHTFNAIPHLDQPQGREQITYA